VPLRRIKVSPALPQANIEPNVFFGVALDWDAVQELESEPVGEM
jgi:hypothetical protein